MLNYLRMGPTASGKTDLAVWLVERFPLEIISVDSALVYRGMDIGTAKPDAATLALPAIARAGDDKSPIKTDKNAFVEMSGKILVLISNRNAKQSRFYYR